MIFACRDGRSRLINIVCFYRGFWKFSRSGAIAAKPDDNCDTPSVFFKRLRSVDNPNARARYLSTNGLGEKIGLKQHSTYVVKGVCLRRHPAAKEELTI